MYFTEGEEKLYAGSPTNNKNSRYSTSREKSSSKIISAF